MKVSFILMIMVLSSRAFVQMNPWQSWLHT